MGARTAGISLSHSGLTLYEQCPRRYALKHLSDYLPVPLRWEVKLQGRLAPWATVVGKIVDETLATALLHFREEGKWPDDLYRIAWEIAGEWWRFSQGWVVAVKGDQACPISRRFQPLDRHYYGEEVSGEEIRRLKGHIQLCLENWLASPLPELIAKSDPSCWRGPRRPGEPPSQFLLEGLPLWAAPDFAIRTEERTWIWDWKTGTLTTGSFLRARDQLLWYALLATREWGVPVEQLRLVPVWLLPCFVANEMEVTQAALDLLVRRIRERQWLLSGLIQLSAGGELPLELWPVTEHVPLCRTCPFRGSCEGARRLQEAPVLTTFQDPFCDP